MKLYYDNLGAWGDEYDGEEYTYEIDDTQMEDFYVDWQANIFFNEQQQKGMNLSKENRKLVRECIRCIARNNDGYVEQLCEELEDEVKEYFRQDAENEMAEYGENRYDN